MFLVQKHKCDQCLFTDNKIVSDIRKSEIILDCRGRDTYFVCHKDSVITGRKTQKLCCRGYWDLYKNEFNMGRIAQRLDMVEEIEVK
jgi:hypothetical protein